MAEPERGMSYEQARAIAERPPLPIDQAFAAYEAAVRASLFVSDAYQEAIEHGDNVLAENLRNVDQVKATARRQLAERELNRAIVAKYRADQRKEMVK